MKTRKIIPDKKFTHDYMEDCRRIQKVLLDHGYQADLRDCAEVWGKYSDDFCAGWLHLPDEDEDLFSSIEYILNEFFEEK